MNGNPCPDYFLIGCAFLVCVIGALAVGIAYA